LPVQKTKNRYRKNDESEAPIFAFTGRRILPSNPGRPSIKISGFPSPIEPEARLPVKQQGPKREENIPGTGRTGRTGVDRKTRCAACFVGFYGPNRKAVSGKSGGIGERIAVRYPFSRSVRKKGSGELEGPPVRCFCPGFPDI
jgi:hypothetical protein